MIFHVKVMKWFTVRRKYVEVAGNIIAYDSYESSINVLVDPNKLTRNNIEFKLYSLIVVSVSFSRKTIT